MRKIGTSVYGLRAPIFRTGDNLVKIITDVVLNCGIPVRDRDVLGITESVVARVQGNYVSVDEIADDIKRKLNNPDVISVVNPIYSRNRFAMILKAISRAANKTIIVTMPDIDEVGNVKRNHPFTGLNYDEYYKSIIEQENKNAIITNEIPSDSCAYIVADIHTKNQTMELVKQQNPNAKIIDLTDICNDKCEYGLLGSNKATEEKLKLFPNATKAQKLVNEIQKQIKEQSGKNIEVMVYGDGCFKDPVGGIWEFADPVVSPAYTSGLDGSPNEIKIKNIADDKYASLSGAELEQAIRQEIEHKKHNLKGNMLSQGTTPRRYVDLLGSLMDLSSGSGDKGTPIILVQGYFDNLQSD